VSVRIKGSMTPLYSDSPTYNGAIVIPGHVASLNQAPAWTAAPSHPNAATDA
jgi:hypothetical protein